MSDTVYLRHGCKAAVQSRSWSPINNHSACLYVSMPIRWMSSAVFLSVRFIKKNKGIDK